MAYIFSESDAQASEIDFYDAFSICKLLDIAASDYNTGFLTETQIWQRYFTLKGAIFQAMGEAMKNIRQDLEKEIKTIPDENCGFFPVKMEKAAGEFTERDKKISEDATHYANLFFDIKSKLNSCSNEVKESLVLLNLAQILKDHDKECYENVVRIVEKANLDHLNWTSLLKHVIRNTQLSGSKTSKKDITETLADVKKRQEQKEMDVKDLSSKIDNLKKLWQKRVRRYKKEIKDLNEEEKHTLECCVTLCDGLLLLCFIFCSTLYQCCCVQHKEKDKENDNLSEIVQPTSYYHLTDRKFLVRNSFRKTDKEQISLRRGEKVKIVVPADYRGLALVEKRGWFWMKKRGLFPVEHLTIDPLN